MKLTVLAFALSVGALTATTVNAQVATQRPERPYRGLFAGDVADWEQSFIANASIGGGYDDNIQAGTGVAGGAAINPFLARRGEYGYGLAQLAYKLTRPRLTFAASAAGTSRYYPGMRDDIVPGYSADATLSIQVRESTRLAGRQTLSDHPYSLLQLFPAALSGTTPAVDVPDEDLAIADAHTVTQISAVGVAQQIGRRASLGMVYAYRRNQLTSRSGDVSGHEAGAVVTFGLKRGIGARLGYQFTQSKYSAIAQRGDVHQLIAGIDYNRRLSVSRQTTLSLNWLFCCYLRAADGLPVSWRCPAASRDRSHLDRLCCL